MIRAVRPFSVGCSLCLLAFHLLVEHPFVYCHPCKLEACSHVWKTSEPCSVAMYPIPDLKLRYKHHILLWTLSWFAFYILRVCILLAHTEGTYPEAIFCGCMGLLNVIHSGHSHIFSSFSSRAEWLAQPETISRNYILAEYFREKKRRIRIDPETTMDGSASPSFQWLVSTLHAPQSGLLEL